MANQTQDDRDRIAAALATIKHTFIVLSGKGGVGKSTVAVNLAAALARRGAAVGLMDVDLHGPNIPKMLNIERERVVGDETGIVPATVAVASSPGLKVMSMGLLLGSPDAPVIWRGPMKMSAIRQFLGDVHWGALEYLVIDLPPGTGDEPLSVAQLIPNATGAVIVTTPQEVALLDSRKAVNFARALRLPVAGLVENMSGFVCPHCGERTDLFKTGGGERSARDLGVPFLGAVPIDPRVVISGDDGRPIVLAQPDSPAAQAFTVIVDRLVAFAQAASTAGTDAGPDAANTANAANAADAANAAGAADAADAGRQ